MPAPKDKTTIESQMLTQHNVELETKAFRAANAYNLLEQYNWQGTGNIPNFSWTCPLGNDFAFSPGAGEILLDGSPYSTLNSSKKRIFFQYLPKFIQACLDFYDENYGL